MEITTFMLVKGILILIAIVIYGLWKGFTGR